MARPRRQPTRLDPFAGYLQARWNAGCHNANQLWREIRVQGYAGSHRMVMLWAQVGRAPTERHAARPSFNRPLLITLDEKHLRRFVGVLALQWGWQQH